MSEYSIASKAGTIEKAQRFTPTCSAKAPRRNSTVAAATNEKAKKTRDAIVAADIACEA